MYIRGAAHLGIFEAFGKETFFRALLRHIFEAGTRSSRCDILSPSWAWLLWLRLRR
jgi:hypothetical protein